jgi:hypothetical protein
MLLTRTPSNTVIPVQTGLKIPRSLGLCGFDSRPRHHVNFPRKKCGNPPFDLSVFTHLACPRQRSRFQVHPGREDHIKDFSQIINFNIAFARDALCLRSESVEFGSGSDVAPSTVSQQTAKSPAAGKDCNLRNQPSVRVQSPSSAGYRLTAIGSFFILGAQQRRISRNALQASVATGIAMTGPGDSWKTEEDPLNREVVI